MRTVFAAAAASLFALVAPGAITATASPTDAVVAEPYLQLGGKGGLDARPPVVVRWFTVPPAAGRVELRAACGAAGADTAWRVAGDSPAVARHAVVLDGLLPDASYEYRLSCPAGGAPGGRCTFTTLPAERATPFTFVVYGDNRSRPESHRAVTRRILAGPRPRFLINTGDLLASGDDSLGWHREFFAPGRDLFACAPILATPGNHELRHGRPRVLSRLWFENLTLPGHGGEQGQGRWWAVRAGGCLLIGLDSTEPRAAGQIEWLAATLAAADPRDFVIVCLHHPLYSWGGHDADAATRAAWGHLLDDNRVDVVFAGHNHFYQRTYPLRGGTPTTRRPERYRAGLGTVHCVAGGGGAPLYTPLNDARVAAQSETCHFVRVDYAPGVLTCTAIAVDGDVIDRFVLEKPGDRR